MTKAKNRSGRPLAKRPSVGERIVEGLEEALAWSKGEEVPVRLTHVQVPDVDVSISESKTITEGRSNRRTL